MGTLQWILRFYLEKEPMTSGQQRLLLRECIVDLLMLHGKTCVDGRRYIPHGELVFNFFDEIELRSGIKLRDLLSKDEVGEGISSTGEIALVMRKSGGSVRIWAILRPSLAAAV